MKIGLFFGSFNPIHLGHMIIANYMANHTYLDKVWIVVSPQNPLKDKSVLINTYDRLEMCKLAFNDDPRIQISDIELQLPQPSYTIDTLVYLSEKYSEHEFSIIMGADNLNTLKKWKNFEVILRDYKILVYPRAKEVVHEFLDHPNVSVTETPIMEISSTFIRNAIKNKKDIRYYLPDSVTEFINAKSLYR
ncbi:MAG: nicotinate-nucleotide adenylyltransferase [Sphingobacteriales bacterium]|nr:nicotinate-nucleotide adenylyltransferase [Sphingobacteriales bacterium]